MSMTQVQSWEAYVDRILKCGRGERAVLKRNIGNLLEESRGCLGIAFRLKEGLPLGMGRCAPMVRDNILFMMATLCAYHPEETRPFGMGSALRELKRKTESGSLDAKVTAMLDENVAEDPKSYFHHFSRLVRLLKSHDINLDWSVVMSDIAQWNRTDKLIQKKWMRDYVKEVKADVD